MAIEDLLRKKMAEATAAMAEQISQDLYRDWDPLNTEWWNAVWTASKHYRKRRRKFFDLWLDEMRANRVEPFSDGLAQVLRSSSTYSLPIIYKQG